MSRAPTPSKLPAGVDLAGAAEPVSRSAAATIRSLGWELHCLRKAARLLAARAGNRTLSPALIEFLTPVLSAVGDGEMGEMFSLKVFVRGNEVRVARDALAECGVNDTLLALLHLPALRGFWERALRRSHFHRLRRVLPRAWFVTADAPPVGAVVPGLGIASWDRLKNDDAFLRVPFSSAEIVVETVNTNEAPALVARYFQIVDRINLHAVA